MSTRVITLWLFALLLSACAGSAATPAPTATTPPPPPGLTVIAPTATATVFTPTATPTLPLPAPLTPCGVQLPILPNHHQPTTTSLAPDWELLALLQSRVPDSARTAFDYLLANPGNVGLAAYRINEPTRGVYLNADTQMPLASVVKVLHLVAYAEAVAAGQLNPFTEVPLADIEAYYQPGLDLNAHRNAVADLEERERLYGNPPTLLLDEVPGMMIEFSDNAATDYLHLLLGQTALETTALTYGLTQQTAPCPFVGQFLSMANPLRPESNDDAVINAYLADPASYGRDAMALTLAYSTDPAFRAEVIAFRDATRRPTGPTQRLFTATLNAHGTPAEYAALMTRIATNGLATPDASYLARRYLEWPTRFAANQDLFTNVAYKGGSLPGVLTLVYYAYPLDGSAPIVVALFFRDLEGDTYRTWRRTLAHDEFARWLLSDPDAIPLLATLIGQ